MLKEDDFENVCPTCKGDGEIPCDQCDLNEDEDCEACEGTGFDLYTEGDEEVTCYECGGTGLEPCDCCDGSGFVTCPDCGGDFDIENEEEE